MGDCSWVGREGGLLLKLVNWLLIDIVSVINWFLVVKLIRSRVQELPLNDYS